jgi:hypothetical protein
MPRSRIVSALASLLAFLVVPVALAATWTDAVVSDTDRYVEVVGPLAEDPAVVEQVTRRLEDAALRAVDPQRLPPAARATAEDAVHRVVVRVVQGPEFPGAWRAANRSAHDQLVAVLSGDDARVVEDGRVSVELGTLLDVVIDALDAKGLVDATSVPQVRTSFELGSAEELERAQTAYAALDALGFWAPVAWVLLALVALLLAPARLRALRALGYGAIAGGLLLAVAVWVGRAYGVHRAPGEDRTLVRAVADVVLDSLWTSIWVTVGLGVLAVLAGLVGGVLTGGRRGR